jgi:hypothetical protein
VPRVRRVFTVWQYRLSQKINDDTFLSFIKVTESVIFRSVSDILWIQKVHGENGIENYFAEYIFATSWSSDLVACMILCTRIRSNKELIGDWYAEKSCMRNNISDRV